MTLATSPLTALDGQPLDPSELEGRTVLVVNVASKCGLTPQYAALERLQQRYGGARFTVLGVPCNQFKEQEPGTADEIQAFCSVNYSITFPMTEKLEVNGPGRHPLYDRLTDAPDVAGKTGDVEWNFEKFLVSDTGEVLARFRPQTDPEADEVIAAIESALRE